jgi:small redox-active disulfide protein 2
MQRGEKMRIQVLGMGCAKCNNLGANVREAVAQMGIEAEIEEVKDIQKIMAMGVMTTPALAVDGKVVSSGRVLAPSQIIEILKEHS